MISIASLFTAAILLITARIVTGTTDPALARHRASWGATIALAVAVIFLVLDVLSGHPTSRVLGFDIGVLPYGLLAPTNLVTCALGLLTVSMSPLATHPPATLGRILVLLAIAVAFIATQSAAALALLWGLSGWVAWRELRSKTETHATARLFARFQVPSTVLMLAGGVLFAVDAPLPAVIVCLLSIAIREATIPVHGWFPTFVQRAPLGLVVAFIAPQLGVYAHVLLLSGIVPVGLAHGVAILGAVTAVLAAGLGVVQSDARRALAFLVMSQTGLVAFGLENASIVARSGALVTWQVLALATSGFAMTMAALEARRGTLSLRAASGSFERTPRMAVAFLFLGFASVGLPLTLGFVAEDLLVQGSSAEFPLMGFALIIATAFNGMTVMRCFFALFSGTRKHQGERDLTRRESWALTVVMALLLVAGAVPNRLLRLQGDNPIEQRAPD